uniref:Uncharacterized protein n=1 Tax=Avena sativa TaxID=4498 RepID=A0ACD5Y3I7_AVESA
MDQLTELLREGLKMDAAGKMPAVQGEDSEEQMEAMEKVPSNRISDEVLQLHAAGQSMQPSDQKEMQLAKLLKYQEENQPQKQENQPRKQQKKKHHHRKGRMALRKIEMDKVKKSSRLEKPPIEEDKAAAYLAAWEKERESEPESEARSDWHAYQARLCRDRWNESWTYETPTPIPAMRFTDYVDASAGPHETLQIFSVKVGGVKEGVVWPLCLYGKLAVRDTVDRKRNIIFDRQRENFQTVTEQDPYLTLTGPSRAAVLSVHHSYIEVELKVKGISSSDSSDDKDFSYLAIGYIQIAPFQSFIVKRVLSSRLSTLELTAGHIVNSVEATINVEVSSGEWPYGHGGAFTVSTASMDAMEMMLLSFGDDGGLPLENDGKKIRLSRRVVGVEVDGRLNVKVKASPLPGSRSKVVLSDELVFTPREAGRSQLMLKVGSCEMKVTVAWSLLLRYDN